MKEAGQTQQFQGLAEIYLQEPYRSLSLQRAKYVSDVFKSINFNPRRIIDLGCGAGFGSEVLALELGSEVMGIDISEKMLDQARNLSSRNSKLNFINMDMRNIVFPEGAFDAATCMFDSLNYLDQEELYELIRNMKSVIRKSGYIALDFLTQSAFGDTKTKPDSMYKGHNFYYFSRAENMDNIVKLELLAFMKTRDRLYRKIEETHYLSLFNANDVVEQLKSSGFGIRRVFDGEELRPVDEKSWHVLLLAENDG